MVAQQVEAKAHPRDELAARPLPSLRPRSSRQHQSVADHGFSAERAIKAGALAGSGDAKRAVAREPEAARCIRVVAERHALPPQRDEGAGDHLLGGSLQGAQPSHAEPAAHAHVIGVTPMAKHLVEAPAIRPSRRAQQDGRREHCPTQARFAHAAEHSNPRPGQ